MSKSTGSKPQPHDAGTGRFVTKPYADRHPKTTVFVKPKH
jgi:hypothetical protein